MRRFVFWLLLIGGSLLLFLGFGLLGGGQYIAVAQDFSDADYVGASECGSCHRAVSRDHEAAAHTLALQEVSRRQEEILADFSTGEELRLVQFPGDDEARPFTADDIEYVIGSGRYVQRYLFSRDRDDYVVLPAEWNTVEQKWQPYTLAETWPDAAYEFGPNCAGCHTTGLNVSRFRWEDDGVQCEACHGPASVHTELASDAGRSPSDEELAEIRAAIYIGADPQVCGQCHSSGTEPENNYLYPIEYRPGGQLLDEAVFRLVAPDDSAHFWPSGHASQPNMQFNEWLLSAHAESLNALKESDFKEDSCLICHSGDYRFTQARIALVEAGDREGAAPEPVTVDTAQFGITCVTCHNPHSDGEQPDLLVAEPYSLCAECHTQPTDSSFIHHPAREMYEGLPLIENIEAVPGTHFTAEDGPNCLTCHVASVPVTGSSRASHALQPILPDTVRDTAELMDSCSSCHLDAVNAASLQRLIDDVQNSTRQRLDAAQAALTADSPEWARSAVDFVQGDGSLGIHNYAYANTLLSAAENALGLASSAADVDVRSLINVPLPAGETTAPVAPATPAASGLTAPSLILLGIAGLIILAGAYAFFVRGDRQ